MAGYFELVDAPDGGYRIQMVDGAGTLMAVSVTFPTKRAAAAGVEQAREIAGTGLIRDRSADGQPAVMGSAVVEPAVMGSTAVGPAPRSVRRAPAGANRSTSLNSGPASGPASGPTSGPLSGSLAAGKRARAHH